MKILKHVEDSFKCNECYKEIAGNRAWYKIKYHSDLDFCTEVCAEKYRQRMFVTERYYPTRELIGNTD